MKLSMEFNDFIWKLFSEEVLGPLDDLGSLAELRVLNDIIAVHGLKPVVRGIVLHFVKHHLKLVSSVIQISDPKLI